MSTLVLLFRARSMVAELAVSNPGRSLLDIVGMRHFLALQRPRDAGLALGVNRHLLQAQDFLLRRSFSPLSGVFWRSEFLQAEVCSGWFPDLATGRITFFFEA